LNTVEKLAKVRALISSGRMQEIREDAHLTRPELGAQVGASAMTIWRWESGEHFPHGQRALRLLRVLERLESQLNGSKEAAHG